MSGASTSQQPVAALADEPPLKQQRTASFDPFAVAQYSAFHTPMLPTTQQQMQASPNGIYTAPGTMWPPGTSPQPLQPLSPYTMQSSPHMLQAYPPFLPSYPPNFNPFPPQQRGGFPSDANGGMRYLQPPPGGGHMMNGQHPMMAVQMQSGELVNVMPMQLMQMNSGEQMQGKQSQHFQQPQQTLTQAPPPASSRTTMNFSCHQWYVLLKRAQGSAVACLLTRCFVLLNLLFSHTTYDETSLMFCTTLPNGIRKRRCRKKYVCNNKREPQRA